MSSGRGKIVAELSGHSSSVFSIAVDDRYIYSGSNDMTARIWGKDSWSEVTVLKGHSSSVFTIAVDEHHIYTGSGDTTVRVWRKDDFSVATVLGGHSSYVFAVAVDDQYVYTGSADSTVRVWHKDDWLEIAVLRGGSSVRAVAVDEQYVYLGLYDETVWVWRKDDWSKVIVLKGHSSPIISIGVDNHYVYSRSNDMTLRVWSKDDWSEVAVLEDAVRAIVVDDEYVHSGFLDQDGRIWRKDDWSEVTEQNVSVWRKDDWSKVKVIKGHCGKFLSLAQDKDYLYTGSSDGKIRVWSKRDWSERAVLEGERDSIYSLALDEGHIYSGSRDGLVVIHSKPGDKNGPMSMEEIIALEAEADRLVEAGESEEARALYDLIAVAMEESGPYELGVGEDDIRVACQRIRSRKEYSTFIYRAQDIESVLEELENLKHEAEEHSVSELEKRRKETERRFKEEIEALKSRTKVLGWHEADGTDRIQVLNLKFRRLADEIQDSIDNRSRENEEKFRYGQSLRSHDDFTLKNVEELVRLRAPQFEKMAPDDGEIRAMSRQLQERILRGIRLAQKHGWDKREDWLRKQLEKMRKHDA